MAYLLGLIGFGVVLGLIAYFLPKRQDPLAHLLSHTQTLLDGRAMTCQLEKTYVAIYKGAQRVALLTVDPKAAHPVRMFAGVVIVSFKKTPSLKALGNTLKKQQILP